MLEAQLKKVPNGSATRCGAQFDFGQCQFDAVPGATRCMTHGGAAELYSKNKANNRIYQLEQWRHKLDKFFEDPNIKSLREEIAISRMTLEAILCKCTTDNDLLIHSGKIQQTLFQIEKLVSSCNRIEDRLGFVLDKSAVINLADQIVTIVSEYIPEDQMLQLADSISASILATGRDTKG
jgi:hypothetical protein